MLSLADISHSLSLQYSLFEKDFVIGIVQLL